MVLAVALLGLCLAALGVTGILSPPRLVNLVARLQSRSGLYFIAGLRLLIGAALLLVAPDSRAPTYLQVFGAVAILSGTVTPLFGLRRFEALLRWWRGQPPLLVRAWCAVVVLIGLSFFWAVFPGLRTT